MFKQKWLHFLHQQIKWIRFQKISSSFFHTFFLDEILHNKCIWTDDGFQLNPFRHLSLIEWGKKEKMLTKFSPWFHFRMNKLSSNSCPTVENGAFLLSRTNVENELLFAEVSAKVFLVTQIHEKISEMMSNYFNTAKHKTGVMW